jgi:hypothetical protein
MEENNSAEVDIAINVPGDEPQGQKSANIIFTSMLRE